MRFEWLFLGYVLLFQLSFGNITVLPVLGFLLMFFATLRLQKFEPIFKKAKAVLLAAIPFGAALLGLQIYKTVQPEALFSGYDTVYNCVRIGCELGEMATMFFIYLGVKSIGVNAELPALEKHSSRNMAVMGVAFLVETVMTVLTLTLSEEAKATEIYRISMIYPFLILFIWRVLNLWMLITCYLGIVMETDEMAEEKEQKRLAEEGQKYEHTPKKKRKKRK